MTDNKRTAAYEDIFGRPSATHHRPPDTLPPPLHYSQSHSQPYRPPTVQPNGRQYYQYAPQYQQQQYYAQPQEARRSYAPSVSSVQSANYSQYSQPYGQPQPYRNHLAPHPEQYPPAHSIASAQGIIASQPEPPADAGLEALTRQGLTPAQAYQVQVYQNDQPSPQGGRNSYRSHSPLPPSSVTPVDNIQSHYTEPEPSLPPIESDSGSLGIEFPGDDYSQEGT